MEITRTSSTVSTKDGFTPLDTQSTHSPILREDSAVIVSPTLTQADNDELSPSTARTLKRVKTRWGRSNDTSHVKHLSIDSGTSLHSKHSPQSTKVSSSSRNTTFSVKARYPTGTTAPYQSVLMSASGSCRSTTAQKDTSRKTGLRAFVKPWLEGTERTFDMGDLQTIYVKKKKSNKVSVKDIKWTPKDGLIKSQTAEMSVTSAISSQDSSPINKVFQRPDHETTATVISSQTDPSYAEYRFDASMLSSSQTDSKPKTKSASVLKPKKERSKNKSANRDDLMNLKNNPPRLDDPDEFPALVKPTLPPRVTSSPDITVLLTVSGSAQNDEKAATPSKESAATEVRVRRLT